MTPLIVANWKMNPTSREEAQRMIVETERAAAAGCEVVLCPPFVFLDKAGVILEGVKLGAQNCSFQEEGSLTGEISPRMLKSFGVEYVIVGHSERRTIFGEGDGTVNQKVKSVLRNGLLPILCVGETAKERDEGKTEETIERQLTKGLDGAEGETIVAYEPVWAIGSGLPCDPETAEKARTLIERKTGSKRIIYGGSVDPSNAREYIEKASFSGLLVGGASLDTDKFREIVEICESI